MVIGDVVRSALELKLRDEERDDNRKERGEIK